MRNSNNRHYFFAIGGFILLSSVALWSFNTLAEPFGGPTLQFKHAVAGVGLLIILKWGLFTGYANRFGGPRARRQLGNS
jgi:hypothetical protein